MVSNENGRQSGRYPFLAEELERLKGRDQFRTLKTIGSREGKWVRREGRSMLNLSSNDYLGLAADESLHQEFYRALDESNIIDKYGLASSSSRLLTGNSPLYDELEAELARLYDRSALVFNSGYHANTGIIPALVSRGDVIFSDKLNHASIVDGMRLSGADFYRFNHCDYEQLEEMLEKNRARYRRALIISESVFSMDGDCADLKRLVELKGRYETLLYIDEAHSVGLFGPNGLGCSAADGLLEEVDIMLGTFGKALSSLGAYLVADELVKDYLINKMRPFIFTTALPPVSLAWSLAVLKRLPSMDERRANLLNLGARLRAELEGVGLETGGMSQLVPVMIGANEDAVRVAEHLQEEGFLLFPIRPPTVPAGRARIRISLSANLEWSDLERLPGLIKEGIRREN